MSPREARRSVNAWWTRASDAEKAARAAVFALALLGSAWVAVSGFLALPGRMDTVEARVGALEASQDRTSRGVEFLVCRDQRREAGLPLDYCDQFWAKKTFLPPPQVVQ